HTFISIDIQWFMPLEEFKALMDAFIAEIKSSKLLPGFTEVLVPGEIDYRREQEYRRNGARIDPVIFNELRELAATLKIDFPFQD
ncbi:MAG: Ldh family oxidoreductase, partial [Dehalococcoidia bacterium]